MSPFDEATLAQIKAADPTKNTWVSANAGSGKTRVLTDRVARLLLHNTDPQRILCLTYTKAAAAEMQNRLFKRLGEWAMLPDDELRNALQLLGEESTFLDLEKLNQARTLFAAALETPGGLKVQTIHSFCDALLRRFPLEAGVAPQFNVLEDRQAKQLRSEVIEQMAQHLDTSPIDELAKHFTRMDTDELTREIVKKRTGFKISPTHSDFNVQEKVTIEQLGERVFIPFLKTIEQLITLMSLGSKNDVKISKKLGNIDLEGSVNQNLKILENVFLNGVKAKSGPFSAKETIATLGTIPDTDPLFVLQLEIATIVESNRVIRLALNAYERTQSLHKFANSFLTAYDERKASNALLDYDDLINLSAQLLTKSSMAQWVLYRLDGGLDHILVDEAQDTSPSQWAVIDCLAHEFTHGASANDRPRSLFVVGDEKQSIYSFQGADPDVFGEKKIEFETLLKHIDQELVDRELLHSFRSAPPILNLVDHIFAGYAGAEMKAPPLHKPFHNTKPGRVDLWPFIEKEKAPDKEVWYRPIDLPAPNDPKQELARRIAHNLRDLLDSRQIIKVENEYRPITAGDILILVQGREAQSPTSLFREILKELKSKGIPVAGADRLNVGDELAVRDILSLLQFANMADDDLSLAEAMRSPLLNMSEGELFSVAHARKGTLWQSLRERSEYEKVLVILHDIRKQVDYLRPYELIERILTKHNGRQKLLSRLGPEVEDGIDELLAQSLQYEALEPPTLSGFLHWFVSGEVEIKRDMGKSNQIRVMTVHGSKGLESPVVILPDTGDKSMPQSEQITLANGKAIWRSTGGEGSKIQNESESLFKSRQSAEKMRLLYVALTRAESWLIICGARERKRETAWYNLVESAMIDLKASTISIDGMGDGLSLESENWAELGIEETAKSLVTDEVIKPSWISEPAIKLARPKQPMAPSKLGGAKALPNDNALPENEAKIRGKRLHKLLEHLPAHPKEARLSIAHHLLNSEPISNNADDINILAAEAIALLDNPNLSHIFFGHDSLAEVGITAYISQLDNNIVGYIDRLIIRDTTILAVDFKSNAGVPLSVEETPIGILAQQAAYFLALEQIYPNHSINMAILWTRTGEIMAIPNNIAIKALKSIQELDDSSDRS